MGDKLSKVSCVKSNNPRRKKRKGRKERSSPDEATSDVEQCSVYEAIRRDMAIKERSRPPSNASSVTRRSVVRNGSRKTIHERSISQVVLLPTKELNAIRRRESAKCILQSDEVRNNGDGKCAEEKKIELIPDTSKKIGNSIELLHCPDMSTITMQTEPSCVGEGRRGSIAGAPVNILMTPSYAQNMDDLTKITEMENEDGSNTSLTVPPNSVNSQFISGITPLDSAQDPDFYSSANNDSVFHHDSPFLKKYFLDGLYYAQYQADNMFINNNSITTNLSCGNNGSRNQKQTTGNSSMGREISDGPGLDSDFGASAGIEMRIVSSDFSETHNNASNDQTTEDGNNSNKKSLAISGRTNKQFVKRSRDKILSPRAHLAATKRIMPGQRIPPIGETGGFPLVQMTPRMARNGLPVGFLHPGLRRPATIAGPEIPSFHVTMEWDPYDTDYGTGNWMEYFIPGVSYPSYPILCDDQYWM